MIFRDIQKVRTDNLILNQFCEEQYLMTDMTREGDKDLSVMTMHYMKLCKLHICRKILFFLDFTTYM